MMLYQVTYYIILFNIVYIYIGTSESWVVKMYANHLLEGIKQVIPVIEKGIQNLVYSY